MKYSLKHQMMAVYITLLSFVFIVVLFCNVWLLEPYYIKDKKEQFVEMYQLLLAAEERGLLDNANADLSELTTQAEQGNIMFLTLDMGQQKICTNVRREGELQLHLDAFLLDQKEGTNKVLETTDRYEVSQGKSRYSGSEYLMMRGTLEGGHYFLIQSPVESIRDSISIANHFLIGVAAIVGIVCFVLIWFFSKRITEPLMELAELSERMAEQDFEAKYTSGGENEIGILGENFNRMAKKLEDAISDLKSANNQLLKDIEQKEKMEKMRNEFLGNVSHELKTPLALIQGYAEGLKDNVNEDPESREFYCDVIIDEASKMNGMVKNLLTLNQLEFGDDEVRFERFDLTAMVQGILQSMELFAEQSGAKVLFHQKKPIYVWADELKVEQVLTNYLKNAFNHVDNERIIDVRMDIHGELVRTTVFNTGKQIPKESMDHIWEKFYKVDKAHTREYGGNGIGLSIVKAIMDSMHQKYGVENYENGVAFWFELGIK